MIEILFVWTGEQSLLDTRHGPTCSTPMIFLGFAARLPHKYSMLGLLRCSSPHVDSPRIEDVYNIDVRQTSGLG